MDYQEAIETVQDIHDVAEARIKIGDARGVIYITPDKLEDVKTAISALQELQLYKDGKLCLISESVYSKQCDELDAYKQIGTPEEVQEAVKRNKEKKVIEMVHGRHGIFDMGKSYNCPMCGSGLRYRYSVCEPIDNYCAICGQKIDWSEEDD